MFTVQFKYPQMNIIIVGANGFIGSHLASFFNKIDAHNVFAINWREESIVQIKELCITHKIDVLINATGSANVALSVKSPSIDFEANVLFHFKLLDMLKDFHCKYIYFSSAAVYGNTQQSPVLETADMNPVSPYGWHKYFAEQMCKEFASLYHVQTASLRLFSVFGPGQTKMLFYDLFNKCNKNEDFVELQGSGTDSRDFIYVEDVMLAVEKVLTLAPMQGECYNIASGVERNINDVAVAFVKLAAPNKKIKFSGNSIPGYPSNWKADISLISNMGFVAETNFEQGLKQTIQWLKENV